MTENEAIKEFNKMVGDRMKTKKGISEKQHELFQVAMDSLEEIQQYRAIGTVDECHAAVERLKTIRPKFEINFGDFESMFSCECGKKIVVRHDRGIMDKHNGPNFCSNCGKSWDWSDSE